MEVEHNKESTIGLNQTKVPPLPEGKSDEPKLYHNRIPGSTFIDREGEIHQFNHAGEFETYDLGLQYELDKIAGKVGSMVYIDRPKLVASDFQPVNDVQTRAAEVVKQLQELQNKNTGG